MAEPAGTLAYDNVDKAARRVKPGVNPEIGPLRAMIQGGEGGVTTEALIIRIGF